jgi:hypothetical protein
VDGTGAGENPGLIFRDRYRVDLQTFTPGLRFEQGWARRNRMSFQGVPFWVASREAIIASKLASGREVDVEDVRILQQHQRGSDE